MADRSENPAPRQKSARAQSVLIAIPFALIICVSADAQLTSQTPEHAAEHLRGMVVNSVTHEPISRALVLSQDNHFAIMTDDRGRFDFTFPATESQPATGVATEASRQSFGLQNVAPINRPMQLMARKVGFLATDESQEVYQVGLGQQDVTISLMPEARIVGHVILPRSDDSEKIQVALYRRILREAREQWESAGNVSTRADGEFRIAELRPGSYKLLTLEHLDRNALILNPRRQLFGYPPLYYPSASDFATAAIIQLKPGETFQPTMSPVAREYYPVKLPFTNPLASPQIAINVWPNGHPGPGYSLGYDPRDGATQGWLPDGTYTLQATNYGPSVMAGAINFTVAGTPVSGPAVTLVPGTSTTINVREEFQQKPVDSMERMTMQGVTIQGDPSSDVQNPRRPNYLQVTLLPDEEFGLASPAVLRPPTGPDDELLVIENILPGRYRVSVSTGLGYVSSITSAGTDLLRHPLVVGMGASLSPMEIIVRDDGAEVDGTVDPPNPTTDHSAQADISGPSPGVVYIVPIDKVDAQPKMAWADPEGKFTIQQLAPGTYHVFALDRPDPQPRWASEEWLKHHESKVQILRLVEQQKEHVHLSMIKTRE